MTHPPEHPPVTDLYVDPPPWDLGRPQPVFLALAEAGAFRGRILDAGCGTGEHTLLAAGLGLDATGIDLDPTAVEASRRKAADRDLSARFLRHDARRLPDLGEQFDTVLDCGLFHSLRDRDLDAYLAGLRHVVPPGGRCFLLAIGDQQPAGWEPHRRTREQITMALADGWRVDALDAATMAITSTPDGVAAWLVAATRI